MIFRRDQIPAAIHSPGVGCSEQSCEEPSVSSPGPWEQDQGGSSREGAQERVPKGGQQSSQELPRSRTWYQLCTKPCAPTIARKHQLLLTLHEGPTSLWGLSEGENKVPGEHVEEMAPQPPCRADGRMACAECPVPSAQPLWELLSWGAVAALRPAAAMAAAGLCGQHGPRASQAPSQPGGPGTTSAS